MVAEGESEDEAAAADDDDGVAVGVAGKEKVSGTESKSRDGEGLPCSSRDGTCTSSLSGLMRDLRLLLVMVDAVLGLCMAMRGLLLLLLLMWLLLLLLSMAVFPAAKRLQSGCCAPNDEGDTLPLGVMAPMRSGKGKKSDTGSKVSRVAVGAGVSAGVIWAVCAVRVPVGMLEDLEDVGSAGSGGGWGCADWVVAEDESDDVGCRLGAGSDLEKKERRREGARRKERK